MLDLVIHNHLINVHFATTLNSKLGAGLGVVCLILLAITLARDIPAAAFWTFRDGIRVSVAPSIPTLVAISETFFGIRAVNRVNPDWTSALTIVSGLGLLIITVIALIIVFFIQ